MDHQSFLLSFDSAADARRIVDAIERDTSLVDDLMKLFFSDSLRICQKSAWIVGMLAEKQPQLLQPYLPQMLECIKEPKHDAVVRNTLRAWSFMDIDEAFEGPVYSVCYFHTANPTSPIAFRAHAMAACFRIAAKYPELLEELRMTLREVSKEEGKGVPARARKILTAIDKMKKGS